MEIVGALRRLKRFSALRRRKHGVARNACCYSDHITLVCPGDARAGRVFWNVDCGIGTVGNVLALEDISSDRLFARCVKSVTLFWFELFPRFFDVNFKIVGDSRRPIVILTYVFHGKLWLRDIKRPLL